MLLLVMILEMEYLLKLPFTLLNFAYFYLLNRCLASTP